MCGRFAMTLPPEAARRYFGYVDEPNFPPRYNISPREPIALVSARDGSHGRERRFKLAQWGFLPGFVKDPATFRPIINARIEGIVAKPSFRAAMRRRRRLIVADGFYEWRTAAADRGGLEKFPYLVRRITGEPMGLAGLEETWIDPFGSEVDTACIITTPANALARRLHDRMPAIIEPEQFSAWLDNDGVSAKEAAGLLKPAREDLFELVPLGRAVNRAANDGPDLQTPIGPPIRTPDRSHAP